MKIKFSLIALVLMAAPLIRAEPVKIVVATQAGPLLQALAALDGQDVIADQTQPDGSSKKVPVKVAYDFGKDSVRIRLSIRKDLLAIRAAAEAYDTSRMGYVKTLLGGDQFTPDQYTRLPAEKRTAFEAKMAALLQPVALDLDLLTEPDLSALAGAGVPGTVSMSLEPICAHPAANNPPKK